MRQGDSTTLETLWTESHLVGGGSWGGRSLLGRSLLGTWLAELLLKEGVDVGGELVHVDGGRALNEDAAVCGVKILNVRLVVVGLDLLHASGRQVAHINRSVSVVSHGGNILVEVAQAGSEVRLELLRRLALTLVLVSTAAKDISDHGGTNTGDDGTAESGFNESREGDEGGSGDGGEGNHFC